MNELKFIFHKLKCEYQYHSDKSVSSFNEIECSEVIPTTEALANNNLMSVKSSGKSLGLSVKLLQSSSISPLQDIKQGQDKYLTEYQFRFDVVIASDCLFFTDFHNDFLSILSESLVKFGKAYLLQPRRGNTMSCFLELVDLSKQFQIEVLEDYLPEVWNKV